MGTIRLEVTGTSYDKSGADLEIIILQGRCMAEGVATIKADIKVLVKVGGSF